MALERAYKDPAGGENSDIGTQFETFYYQKKALIEAKKEQYFSQMADTTAMPKHFGKTIKRYHYLPLLDDANINDQGIDALGLTADGDEGTYSATAIAHRPTGDDLTSEGKNGAYLYQENTRFVADHAVAATAATDAIALMDAYLLQIGFANQAAAELVGWTFTNPVAGDAVPNTGNLYGSSKDVGTIAGKMPTLSEIGRAHV